MSLRIDETNFVIRKFVFYFKEKDERNHDRKPKSKTKMDSRKTSNREKLPRTPQFGG